MNNFDLIIYKLIARELGLSEFEQWVYSEKELETFLSSDDYLNIISLNYKPPSALYEAEKILRTYINIGKYYEWHLRRVLQKIIDRPDDAYKYIEQCYDMYCDGYYFIDNLGLSYGLSVAVPPSNGKDCSWDMLESVEQRKLVDGFYPAIAEEAEKVIHWLESGKIVLTGHDDGYQEVGYEDNRPPEEHLPTGYKVSTPSKKWWKFW